MNDYILYADSSCDTPREILQEWGVSSIDLLFRFADSTVEYRNSDVPAPEFYHNLREGRDAKTSAINSETFREEFDRQLREGRDVLYIAFSSGLSTTYNSARIAAKSLSEEYPNRKILVVDSLSASAGYSMLVYLTVQKLRDGATLEEAAEFAHDTRLHICHWFTVDDLNFLRRGGRVSAAAAIVGTALGIKPILHMDNEGHLINMFNVRGRKRAISALAAKLGELAEDITSGPIYISHGDCIEDAEELARQIKEEYGLDTELITDVGPVIGAHSGPGTLALFFVGRER